MTTMSTPTGQNVAYIRVSTVDQNTARQLCDTGIAFDERFTEKVSAKDAKRPQLEACLRHLRKGDTLHVHSIDRLARNLMDLQRIVTDLNERGVAVRFHKERLTFDGQDDHLGKLMLQMMGAFAEFERSLIRERQREGIAAAKRAGRRIGRPSALTPTQVAEIREKASTGRAKAVLAREYGVDRQTIYNVLQPGYVVEQAW